MGLNYFSASIVVGNTTTDTIILGENNTPVGLTTQANITSGSLTFLVSKDNQTFLPLYDSDSNEISLTVTSASRAYELLPLQTWAWRFMKIREGTSASSVAQASSNTLFTIVTRKIQ